MITAITAHGRVHSCDYCGHALFCGPMAARRRWWSSVALRVVCHKCNAEYWHEAGSVRLVPDDIPSLVFGASLRHYVVLL
jgi:hypothetical protein